MSGNMECSFVSEASKDSSDIEGDMDEEELLMQQYIEILNSIDQDKYNYDHYIQLVDIANKLSDLEKIRQSYELFSSIYPLAPNLWLQWLTIEENIAYSEEEVVNVENLFKRALSDYFSADVALKYGLLAFKSPKVNQIWQELLSVYALHCMKGRQFFIVWRKFLEERNLPENVKRDEIIKSYLNELCLPLYNIEESYIELKVLYEKKKDEIAINWEKIDKEYNASKCVLNKILPFERQLTDLDQKEHKERLEIFYKYITAADELVSDNILQIIYERMVTECCLNPDCWLKYTSYLEQRYKDEEENGQDFFVFKQTPLSINDRALKNCPWSEKLYIKKMQLYEKDGRSKAEVQGVFENALEAGFHSPEPVVMLWINYLSYLVRHTNYEDRKEVDTLRANFNLAWSSLGRQWGVLADCDCEILKFWGKLEYGPLKDPTKGRELWNTIMESSDNASKSGLWIEFIHLELKNSVEEARKLFQKALSVLTLDNPSVVTTAFMRFEYCNGTLNSLVKSQEYCDSILTQFYSKTPYGRKTKLKPKINKKPKHKDTDSTNKIGNASLEVTTQVEKVTEKLKEDNPPKTKKTKILKEHENEEIDTAKDHLRIFLSNLDYNITEEDIRNGLPELEIVKINLIKAANGRGRGFAYVELESEEEVNKALKLDGKMLKDRPLYISSVLRDKESRQKFKYSGGLEPAKLFVKGVPYNTTKEELQVLFEPFGKLRDIRIVYHKSGKPKGIAYVEYEEESSASAAILKLDHYDFKGNILNVAISAPPPKSTPKDTINLNKLLNIGASRKRTIRGEQKPRMSLVPTVVRKNLNSAATITSPGGGSKEKRTNEDFRNFLQK